MKKKAPILFFIFISFLYLPRAQAANQGDVVINEISWMGTTNSANDEWLELKNTTDDLINLSGWVLKSADEKIKIPLKNMIPAKGFYLLERTDDASVPATKADIIYTGALNNTGQHLLLYDNANNIIDQVNFLSKWPAGNNTTKQTMEKGAGAEWQTSKDPGGTPKNENSNPVVGNPISISQNTPSVVTYPKGIIINEILPAPEGVDETDEWIELYNGNNFEIDISSWKLQDIEGTINTYAFPKGSFISAKGYLIAKRPSTNITLNNDGDGINLLWPDNAIASFVIYPKALANQSYNATDSGYQWSDTLTPATQNIITSPSGKNTAKGLPKTVKTDTNKNIQTASIASAIGEGAIKTAKNNPLFLFFAVLATIIVLTIIILLIKFRVFKKTNSDTNY